MDLNSIKSNLVEKGILLEEGKFLGAPTLVAYDKQFRWSWVATQLNTFVVVTDFDNQKIGIDTIEEHLNKSFAYAKKNYKGWPRGFQAGMGVITILLSSDLTPEAVEYCRKLKTGKKWAGFSIPVLIDTSNGELHRFEKDPMWGKIYYPFFRKLIAELTT